MVKDLEKAHSTRSLLVGSDGIFAVFGFLSIRACATAVLPLRRRRSEQPRIPGARDGHGPPVVQRNAQGVFAELDVDHALVSFSRRIATGRDPFARSWA